MKVLVAVKRVIDYKVKIRIKDDNSGVEDNGVKMSLNPFDEIALEEAIRLREKGIATHVRALSVGPSPCEETLRSALAMGADDAVLVHADTFPEPIAVARTLARYLVENSHDLLLMGKQAIDDDANQCGQMTAGLLDWPQATFASKIEIHGQRARVEREVDSGAEVVEMPLPAVITCDLRLNTPRFISLPNIMQAKKKPLEIIEDFAELPKSQLQVVKVSAPKQRKAGRMLDNVQQLVGELEKNGLLQ